MANGSWRAELRAEDIPRRPPPERETRIAPSSERLQRADRGYVEQPEERVTPAVDREAWRNPKPVADPPRRIVRVVSEAAAMAMPQALPAPESKPEAQALVKLERKAPEEPARGRGHQREYSEEFKAEAVRRVLAGQRGDTPKIAKELGISENTLATWAWRARKAGGAEMAKKKITRTRRGPEVIANAIRAVLEAEAADPERAKMARNGIMAQTARKLGLPEALVTRWVRKHKAAHGRRLPAVPKTLMSAPSGPVSAPRSAVASVRGPLPPVPTVTLAGREEYINALVDKRVAEQFQARMAAMMMGTG